MRQNRNKLSYRIGPGLWVDAAGDLHISIAELLDHFQISDTPENRELATRIAQEAMKSFEPDAKQFHRAAPHCPACNSQHVKIVNNADTGDFRCLDCNTLFCEPEKL